MIHLKLTKAERDILRDVLEYDLSELHREVADTDNWKFKEGLKEKEAILRKIAKALDQSKEEDVI